jgi:hypothetical protein
MLLLDVARMGCDEDLGLALEREAKLEWQGGGVKIRGETSARSNAMSSLFYTMPITTVGAGENHLAFLSRLHHHAPARAHICKRNLLKLACTRVAHRVFFDMEHAHARIIQGFQQVDRFLRAVPTPADMEFDLGLGDGQGLAATLCDKALQSLPFGALHINFEQVDPSVPALLHKGGQRAAGQSAAANDGITIDGTQSYCFKSDTRHRLDLGLHLGRQGGVKREDST